MGLSTRGPGEKSCTVYHLSYVSAAQMLKQGFGGVFFSLFNLKSFWTYERVAQIVQRVPVLPLVSPNISI